MKSRVGLSYSLGDSLAWGNHILPISALVCTSDRVITGGRDGVVKIWHTNEFPKATTVHGTNGVIDEDLDTLLLKLEQAISGQPLPYSLHPRYPLEVGQLFPIHFDWVNDVVLVNFGRLIVLCSLDLLIKVVDCELGQVDKFANAHTDYIKKLLVLAARDDVIYLAGLDGNIIEWDLPTLTPLVLMRNVTTTQPSPLLVYLIANWDRLVAAGGPSNTINLFDPRLPQPFLRKLIGHQDVIRTLAMNETHVVLGSSDTTIKVWDLRTFKLDRTIDVHDHPVWSLTTHSPHDFRYLYSGDREGRIVKTDLSQWASYQLAPAPEFATLSTSESSSYDDGVGVSVVVAENASLILALGVANGTIHALTSHSLVQYADPDTRQVLRYQYLRSGLDHLIDKEYDNNDPAIGHVPDDIQLEFYDLISHLLIETGPAPVMDAQLLLSGAGLTALNHEPLPETDTEDEESVATMFLEPNGGTLQLYVNAYMDHAFLENKVVNPFERSTSDEQFIDQTPVEIVQLASTLLFIIPFNSKPLVVTPIVPMSVISKRIFNNKRQVLVLYSNGDIVTWDLLTCRQLPDKWRMPDASIAGLDDKQVEQRSKDMDALFNKMQTHEALSNWCEVEIKAGKLFVTIKELSFCNVEIYHDDLCRSYPFLQADSLGLPDDRYTVGQILINSLFHEYAVFEWGFDRQVREELRAQDGIPQPAASVNGATLPADLTGGFKKFFGKKRKEGAAENTHTLEMQECLSVCSQRMLSERFLNEELPAKRSPHFEELVYMLIHTNKKIYMENYKSSNYKPGTLVDLALRVDHIDPRYRDPSREDRFPYVPFIDPRTQLPPDLQIMIFEYLSELGNYRELRRFSLNDINLNDHVPEVRQSLPRWIGRPILYNKMPQREQIKLAFSLTEIDYEKLAPHKKIGGKLQKKIKKLPLLEPNIKLASHNMLRVSKILQYLTEKFEPKTLEMKLGKLAWEWLVLECRGIELDPNMTLQTIKARIWKSSSDIELYFRRRFD